MSVNTWIGIGNLTREPELNYSASGKAYCRFTIAVDRGYKGNGSERVADFIPVEIWGDKAEVHANYLFRGQRVCVEGELRIDRVGSGEGQKIYPKIAARKITYLSRKNQGNAQQQMRSGPSYGDNRPPEDDGWEWPEDDLPF